MHSLMALRSGAHSPPPLVALTPLLSIEIGRIALTSAHGFFWVGRGRSFATPSFLFLSIWSALREIPRQPLNRCRFLSHRRRPPLKYDQMHRHAVSFFSSALLKERAPWGRGWGDLACEVDG